MPLAVIRLRPAVAAAALLWRGDLAGGYDGGMAVAAFDSLFPFHVTCIGLLALLCQDAFVKRRLTIRSLFALTTVVSLELAMFRLILLGNPL